MEQVDITYSVDGMFTRFYPETPCGKDVWIEMAKEDGVAAVLNFEAQSIIRQIRKAGYKVAKAKPPVESIEDILKQLED